MNRRDMCEARSPPTDPALPIVHVVDGELSARESMAQLICGAGWQVTTAASAEEFLAQPRPVSSSCLVVDVKLSGMSGLELQNLVRKLTWLPVIFVSGAADIPTTVHAMRAGALEFLTKPIRRDTLIDAIRHALQRSHRALPKYFRIRALEQCYETLSRRERQVMGLVVSGSLNKLVGGRLGISEITVKAHRGQVMRKMGATSLAELVGMAVSLGQVSLSDASRQAGAWDQATYPEGFEAA
jgi:FixJ family two-component response regulator